jgi:isoleucyl-tRNA synthetase
MSAKYKEFTGLNLPAIEKEILLEWEEDNAFEKSVSLRDGATPFVFYEGPPSANGMPGIHHVISRTLKDMVCRYKTMQGFQVKRKGGWDTHGLPVELGVEKELGITKEDIGKKISVEEYNQKCRDAVLRYKDQWDDLTRKMGYWVDLDNPYITFDNKYIETLWWLLSELYKKGLLYESVSIQPYSPAAGTGLSSHELNQPGTYKDVKDVSCVAMFRLLNSSEAGAEKQPVKAAELLQIANEAWSNSSQNHLQVAEVFFMAWTTTPWTLPSNLGLTVGEKIEYVLVKTFNPYTHLPVNVVLAKALITRFFKPEGENGDFEEYNDKVKILPWTILTECKGKDLEGCRYEQLMPYEANSPAIATGDPFRVILGDFVTTEDGTGIVHTAPAFGADDYRVGSKNNIGILTMVDRQGKFIEGMGEFSNRYVKNYKDEENYIDVNVDICVLLKKENRAFKVEKFEHSYPHCWRTDKPILYYPLDAWFIRTTAVKERMVELNKTINWKPKSTGEGRFGNWLENMVDWNLSRSRFWGTPLPIWRTEDGSQEKCIGSIEELTVEFEKALAAGFNVDADFVIENGKLTVDLHKPYVDAVILISDDGQPMRRVPDLVDVWFDSGAMPYAQWHYPFENKDKIDDGTAFPADFICEGVDQTRGWFYTLHALAVMLFDSVAYKTVVSNGLVLDKKGNKMSKRVGNVVNPFETIEQFGADATRWYLITNASPWDNLKFDSTGIQEVQRKFFGTLYNTYQFFALYSNVDGFDFTEDYIPLKNRPEIDRWILSSLNTLIGKVTDALNDYEPTVAGRVIEEFVDEHLSNWYVRLCRRRFWKGEYEADKISAYQTLYECLETITRLMAPISPFFSDAIFRNLNAVTERLDAESVHHTRFPEVNESSIDADLEERMQLAQDVCSLLLSLRKKVNIKVRQPLKKVFVTAMDNAMYAHIKAIEDIIKNEVNVKEVVILDSNNDIIKRKAKANFKTLGKRLGSKMKWAADIISKLDNDAITVIMEGEYSINGVEGSFEKSDPILIYPDDIEVSVQEIPGFEVTSKGNLTVALDVVISAELQQEGDAREFVNRIQNIRKESGLNLSDRIKLQVLENKNLFLSINEYKNYICGEILADDIDWVAELQAGTEIEVNEHLLKVAVIKKE